MNISKSGILHKHTINFTTYHSLKAGTAAAAAGAADMIKKKGPFVCCLCHGIRNCRN